MDFVKKIDRLLTNAQRNPESIVALDAAAHYIDWAWKFRKISREEMEAAVDRFYQICEEMK